MTKESIATIEKNIKFIEEVIGLVVSSPRKESVVKMLESVTGELYFAAPASSKTEYHYAWPGGLVAHSINVYKNLRKLNDTFKMEFSEESMLIVALFHDIGKASTSDLSVPNYLPVVEKWKLDRGNVYDINKDGVYMPNHLRSIFILSQYQISLSAAEFQAIYLNDGQYLQENRPYALKECSLALYLHIADRISLEQERGD